MIDPLLAVLAGMLTIAAPCVLPMLPVVLGASLGQRDRSRPVFIALGFAVAFSAVALLFTAFSQVLGLSQETLRQAAIVMLLLFGTLMIWPRPFAWLSLRMSGLLNRVNALGDGAGSGKLGGLVLGLTLGAVFTPCAGPVLGAILTLVATTPELGKAGVLLACYSLGAALPMLGIAYGGQYASTHVRQLARQAHRLQQGFGVLVILTALAMHFQYDSVAAVWLSDFYPSFQTGL
ncbi:MAG: Cytochrome biosis protein [Polaromonas sp.]|jgi:cytochrome c-type biogenesis protein|nr:Cytochrome biosis protein [Polaromonas sp.]